MTSLTWSFKASKPLLRCGIDAESVDRFEKLLAQDSRPFPLLFNDREIQYIQSGSEAAWKFCVAFCVKEALVKSFGESYDFLEVQVFPKHDESLQTIEFSPEFEKQSGITKSVFKILQDELPSKEIAVIVYVFGTE